MSLTKVWVTIHSRDVVVSVCEEEGKNWEKAALWNLGQIGFKDIIGAANLTTAKACQKKKEKHF